MSSDQPEPINWISKGLKAGQVFTPGAPVSERDMFAGRLEQLNRIFSATSQRGYHAVLYGERGVGKTSLANVLTDILATVDSFCVTRVNCDATDDFNSLWRKAFRDILVSRSKPGLGFGSDEILYSERLIDSLPNDLSPDDVRRTLGELGRGATVLVIFDEFDRLVEKFVTVLMADTIKSLSDFGVNATILLIGVADSVDDLIHGHQSIERALVQIPMPRMSTSEIDDIVRRGLARLEMQAEDDVFRQIGILSQGLPYITHMLGLHTITSAIGRHSLTANSADVEAGIKSALEGWQQSIATAYYDAVRSPQPGNIYREVLLACALAETDELGFFQAASVRSPLQMITNRPYDIPNFARHLKELSEPARGSILSRTGETKRIRYRFGSPLHRPYIVMRGISDGLVSKHQIARLSKRTGSS
jgi:energy-coupling factor transporter ATP-binding protein EcfA2